MTLGKCLFVIMMDVEAEYDEEMTSWYNEEHGPERLACPGFLSGERYLIAPLPEDMATDETISPRYLTIYELDSREALQSPEYLQLAKNPSPRTRRLFGHFKVLLRQVYVGTDEPWTLGNRPA